MKDEGRRRGRARAGPGRPTDRSGASSGGWPPRPGGGLLLLQKSQLNKTTTTTTITTTTTTTTNQNTAMKGKLKNAKQTSCIPYFEILGKNYYLCTIHKTLLNMESRHQILLDSVFRMSLA